MLKTYLASLVFFFSIMATAEELFNPYLPIRSLGMGGAGVAVSNDHDAIWTNPAGIARIRKARSRNILHYGSFPSFHLGSNAAGEALLAKTKFSTNPSTIRKSILEGISSVSSQPAWIHVSSNPQVYLEPSKNKPMAISLLASSSAYIKTLSGESQEKTQIDMVTDLGFTGGMAWTNRTNQISGGLQVRPTMRYGYSDRVNPTDLVSLKSLSQHLNTNGNSGFGLNVDAGAIWTLSDFWFPTLGVAVYQIPLGCKSDYLNPYTEQRQKICGTVYSGTISDPESLSLLDPTDIRFGLSIAPRLSKDMTLRLALDVHHFYFTDGVNFYGLPGVYPLKMIHGGVELTFANPLSTSDLSFRGGINQGFVTTGVSLRASFFSTELAFYSQDIDPSTNTTGEARWVGSLSFDF